LPHSIESNGLYSCLLMIFKGHELRGLLNLIKDQHLRVSMFHFLTDLRKSIHIKSFEVYPLICFLCLIHVSKLSGGLSS
jgi:hypothetical protein